MVARDEGNWQWDLMAYRAKFQFCKMKSSIGGIYKCTSTDEEYLQNLTMNAANTIALYI